MPKSPIIVALDYEDKNAALNFVDRISPESCRLKIGKEMFTRFGPDFVRLLCGKGFEVFLDLKFHDIPYTVANAIKGAADLGVWMIDVHAFGGARMLDAAKEAMVSFGSNAPKLVAITVLTSMEKSDLEGLGIQDSPSDYGEKLANLAYQSGLDGVVCSAQESARFKARFGQSFELITPGIRPLGSESGDQRRTMTPEQAINAGVDYMVIGRPITQSSDPVAVLEQILTSIHCN